MTSIDTDFDGIDQLRSEIQNLKHKWGNEPEWAVGTNADYARALEFGRGPVEAQDADALRFEVNGETVFAQSVSGHPPYPWFRPAIREFERNPEGFIRDTTDFGSLAEINSIEELVTAVATGLSNRMTDNVNAQDPTSDRSPGTHPEHPKRDSGNLSADISAIRIN